MAFNNNIAKTNRGENYLLAQRGIKEYIFYSNCLYVHVFMLTVASAFVRAQLHEVRAGTRKCLIVVDETQVRAGLLAVYSRTWVRSWGEVSVGKKKTQNLYLINSKSITKFTRRVCK